MTNLNKFRNWLISKKYRIVRLEDGWYEIDRLTVLGYAPMKNRIVVNYIRDALFELDKLAQKRKFHPLQKWEIDWYRNN